MILRLGAFLLAIAQVTSLTSDSYTIRFFSNSGLLINCTTPGASILAKLRLDDGLLTEQEKEIRNVNADGTDFVADGCTALAIAGAREPSSGETTSNGFLRAHAYENGTRISLTVYIRIHLVVWSNASACTVTALGNRLRLRENGSLVGNARRSFSIPVLRPPDETASVPNPSPRVVLTLVALLALLLLLISSTAAVGGEVVRPPPDAPVER